MENKCVFVYGERCFSVSAKYGLFSGRFTGVSNQYLTKFDVFRLVRGIMDLAIVGIAQENQQLKGQVGQLQQQAEQLQQQLNAARHELAQHAGGCG